MKAIRVKEHGGPDVLGVEEVPKPTPGPDHVLLRVKAAGVNPVDTYIRAGAYTWATLPYTPGFDAAGVIEAVGPGVSLKVGDRVYTSGTLSSGTYAEYAICPAKMVYRLPDHISFSQGAALGIPYGTAYRALFQRARALPGESVLVHGASGGVGLAAVQLARAAGLKVYGTTSTREGAELVAKEGAHAVLNHKEPNYTDELTRLTSGKGVDVILEMLANVNLGKDLTLLARSGRVVVIGSRGTVEINPRDAMARDASVMGMMLFIAPDAEFQMIHAAILAGLEGKTIRPVIRKEYPLEKAPEAHAAIMEPGAYGKIVLVP